MRFARAPTLHVGHESPWRFVVGVFRNGLALSGLDVLWQAAKNGRSGVSALELERPPPGHRVAIAAQAKAALNN